MLNSSKDYVFIYSSLGNIKGMTLSTGKVDTDYNVCNSLCSIIQVKMYDSL